ncbi:cell shape determination protein CcmA [Rhodoferax koreense]|uniref:Cell shape determination protein CcmA n=1 Tax=Rhodoferax koreensis TaxID=1842727 RepID=A0A1P8JQ34_9BURK|nr:polymer-forming cytoskeletal protein [Rhodoferax koreense]APW35866.1 cell shape determination protein CcmA [Rhodoferax koreense]
MALQSPFFGKRENESLGTRPTTQPASAGAHSVLGSHNSLSQPAPSSATSMTTNTTASSTTPSGTAKEGGSKLTVGPNIKLKGVEITDCDTLVVEGTVEATMDSRVMQIAEMGSFNGSAEIDIAEIHGAFNGDLTVREKLVIYATGRVTGKIRYGKVVIEEGGQLSGEISFGTAASGKAANASAKAPLQAIA